MIAQKVYSALLVIAYAMPLTAAWSDQSLEDAVETLATELRLPATAPGTGSVKNCTACPTVNLQLDASTRYFAAGKEITLAQLHRLFADQARHPVLIATKVNSRTVTRIVVTGEALPR